MPELQCENDGVHQAKESDEVNGTGFLTRELRVIRIEQLDVDFQNSARAPERSEEVVLAISDREVPNVLSHILMKRCLLPELAYNRNLRHPLHSRIRGPLAFVKFLNRIPLFVQKNVRI